MYLEWLRKRLKELVKEGSYANHKKIEDICREILIIRQEKKKGKK